MSGFIITGKNGVIKIEFSEVFGFPKETSYLGGYDVKGKINIQCGNFFVKDADLWFSTGQVYQFFTRLQKCYKDLAGSVTFIDADNNFKMEVYFNRLGQVKIQGFFQEVAHLENILQYQFESEQSYLTSTIKELEEIVLYYGDMEGEKCW
ncbi:WapI family immunity protein [Ornithinibacillus halotolerans]|uniref:Uncharacterized protein n=1 Tax=Ornithinibacillus halotolerans TaxID=1274357 RepID=A0A916W1S5_9BACI|nr:hypothetical protein [Ornithinibacillus halotolerans]GGA60252.1 hypothetical protein GCM10008025_00340 [Ornithinibacillus halotolerans]